MKIKTIMKRETLESLVFNTLKKGYTMEQIHQVIAKLNVEVR